jgi:AcrR family transcriptional regulator
MSPELPRAPSGAKVKKRKRGRPRDPDASTAAIKAAIIAAAGEVYAKHGYHNSSVALVLEAAGVSRPTFYRHFKDKTEVISIVVARANAQLIEQVKKRIGSGYSLEDVVNNGIDAYFAWGHSIGKLAGAIYREIHDEQSPASYHRKRSLADLGGLMQTAFEARGKALTPQLNDALMHVIEHVGHQAFWPKRKSAKEIAELKNTIRTIIIGTVQYAI